MPCKAVATRTVRFAVVGVLLSLALTLVVLALRSPRSVYAAAGPDLSASAVQVSPDVAEVGAVTTHTVVITVVNTGDVGAVASLTMTLPDSLTYVSGTLTHTFPAGSQVVLSDSQRVLRAWVGAGEEISPSQSVTLSFSVRAQPASAGAISVSLSLADQARSYVIAPAIVRSEYHSYLSAVFSRFVSLSASFSGEPRFGGRPLAVSFTDTSQGGDILARFWEFGDGGISEQISPTHVYTQTGVFTVTLIVTNSTGSSRRVEPEYVRVWAACTDYVALYPMGCYLRADSYQALVNGDGLFSVGPNASLIAGHSDDGTIWFMRRGFLTFGPFASAPISVSLVLTSVSPTVWTFPPQDVWVHPGRWGAPLPSHSADMTPGKWRAFDGNRVLASTRVDNTVAETFIIPLPAPAVTLNEGYVNLLLRLSSEPYPDTWLPDATNRYTFISSAALRECHGE